MSDKTINLVALECPTCGVIYGTSKFYQEQRLKDHKSWNCPNGHSIWHPPQKQKGNPEKATIWLAADKRN